MKQVFQIAFLTLTLILSGCTFEDDATIVTIFAEPSSYIVNSGDNIYIDTYVQTINSYLTEINISAFDSEHGKSDILSIAPNTKKYEEKVVWKIPSMVKDTTMIEINIAAKDDKDNSNNISVMLKAIGGNTALLPERSGITLYSPYSSKADAFSFTTLQPLFSASEKQDCDLVFITTENNEDLSLTWGTKTDVVFCKANSFDYASATWANLQTVLSSSIRSETVSNLKVDDVILIGRHIYTEDSFQLATVGVIKITAIYDEVGSENDRITFNLKVLN